LGQLTGAVAGAVTVESRLDGQVDDTAPQAPPAEPVPLM
jgi:hypothetical protein